MTRFEKLQQKGKDEWKDLIQEFRGTGIWRTLLFMLIGIPVFSIAINGLIIPHHFFSGGLTGISLILLYLSPGWSLGLIYFLINIPLFILGVKKITPKYMLVSAVGMLVASLSFELTKSIHIPIEDDWIAAVLGGCLAGLGSGIYFRFGGSAGGLDILGTYFRKTLSIPLGSTFNLFNLAVLGFALIFNDLETTFYSGVFIFCNSWMIDKVQSGFSQRNAVMIITSSPDVVAQEIISRLDRGVTYFYGKGAFTNKETRIVYTVVNATETGRLKDIVYELDPEALVVVLNTSAVIGKKFLTWEDEGYKKPKPFLS